MAGSERHLVLVGMMGSGKTCTGRRAAKRLGRAFHDTDVDIEARTGRTVRQIFADDGEPAFRQIETEVLGELLSSEEPLVVATGGGAVLSEVNRSLARDRGLVVWLRAQPETLVARLTHRHGRAVDRPLLDGDPIATLRRLALARNDLYASAAHQVVDVDTLSTDRVVTALVELARR